MPRSRLIRERHAILVCCVAGPAHNGPDGESTAIGSIDRDLRGTDQICPGVDVAQVEEAIVTCLHRANPTALQRPLPVHDLRYILNVGDS